jgi:hypothetical protein
MAGAFFSRFKKKAAALRVIFPRIFFVVTLTHAAATGGGERFAADANTLLLAHFEDSAMSSDYSNGNPNFAGSAMRTEGYYGQGADLRLNGFFPDYMSKCSLPTPFYSLFGFWPSGNFDYYQGTLEFWFKLESGNARGNLIWAQNGLYSSYISFKNPRTLEIDWSCLKGEKIKSLINLGRDIKRGEWHYFTMTWSPGEFALYIDGRVYLACDMTNRMGLVASRAIQPLWLGSQHYETGYLSMTIDELRVSDIVRHNDNFEPPWKDSRRPSHACWGNPRTERFPGKYTTPQKPVPFEARDDGDRISAAIGGTKLLLGVRNGFFRLVSGDRVSSNSGGLLVFHGLERKSFLDSVSASQWESGGGVISFTQDFGEGIKARSSIKAVKNILRWDAELKNENDSEKWVEALLSAPTDIIAVSQYFDGCCAQERLSFPRRKDSTVSSMPLAIASDGKKSIGAGVDPHQWLSGCVTEWLPGEKAKGNIRQGAKIALDPKSSLTVSFLLITADGEFGFLDALAAYHSAAPDLYLVRRNISPLFNMPLAWYNSHKGTGRNNYAAQASEFARHAYGGSEWLFGPHHVVGDSWASEEYYNNPRQFQRYDYEELKRYYKWYGATIEEYKQSFIKIFKGGYDSYYTGGALHLHPNWPWMGIMEDKYPAGISEGDRLDCGQYYSHWNLCQVNNYHTPIGEKNKKDYVEIIKFLGPYIIGFQNDLCYVTNARCYDPIAQKTPGRAFAPDIGAYILDAYGVADYFRAIQKLNKGALSDGGWINHIMSTVSDKTIAEDGTGFLEHAALHEMYKSGRYMLGEKPFGFIGDKDKMRVSAIIADFNKLTEKELRDYYRYMHEQRFLLTSKVGGIYSLKLMRGFPKLFSYRPMIVEGIMSGVKTVPAVKVKDPLWAVRYGNDTGTILTIGNQEPADIRSDAAVYNKYLGDGDAQYVFTDFFAGAPVRQEFSEGKTTLRDLEIGKRSLCGVRCVAALRGRLKAADAVCTGDGVSLSLKIIFSGIEGRSLSVRPFVPDLYKISKARVDGKDTDFQRDITIPGGAGKNELLVEYTNTVLNFTAAEWQKTEFLRGNGINYRIITGKDADDYTQNTSRWIDRFFYAYDEENGVPDDMSFKDPGKDAWRIYYQSGGIEKSEKPSVKINTAEKSVYIGAADKASARLAMCVLLRLLDRRYPHAGNWYTPVKLKFPGGDVPGGVRKGGDKELAELYAKYDFDKKVLLEEEEMVKINGTDFAGKYKLDFAPYIYEPARW